MATDPPRADRAVLTFAERVRLVAAFGFTDRQAAFLTLVALHGGYCMRRHYAAYTHQRGGQNVTDFLERLVQQHVARRFTYRHDRGHIYHLHAKPLYRAIGQQDNRNRRHASPALVARKLMLLDLVISDPRREWYATEADKVSLFTTQLRVPADRLPQRVYRGAGLTSAPRQHTIRYCVQKLPIFLTGDPPTVHFVCLVTHNPARELDAFIREHASLLSSLSAWTVLVCGPRQIADDRACAAAFARAVRVMSGDLTAAGSAGIDDELRWFFETRRRIETGHLGALSVADVRRFREGRARWKNTQDTAYARWLAHTDAAHVPAATEPAVAAGQLITHWLPFSYQQFGSHPGVS